MEPTPNYLQDLESEVYQEPADKGLRFVNLLIDYIVLIVVLYGLMFAYAVMTISSGNDFSFADESRGPGFSFYFFIYLFYVAFYTLFEGATNGRTLGKLITNTVAVRKDGKPFSFKDALLRSLCRLIPFEALAALFTEPWHDNITNTTVIKRR